MTQEEVLKKVVDILMQYNKSDLTPESISMKTTLLGDLKINSARLVDIVLDFEDKFNIQVADEEADKVETVEDAVKLIESKI